MAKEIGDFVSVVAKEKVSDIKTNVKKKIFDFAEHANINISSINNKKDETKPDSTKPGSTKPSRREEKQRAKEDAYQTALNNYRRNPTEENGKALDEAYKKYGNKEHESPAATGYNTVQETFKLTKSTRDMASDIYNGKYTTRDGHAYYISIPDKSEEAKAFNVRKQEAKDIERAIMRAEDDYLAGKITQTELRDKNNEYRTRLKEIRKQQYEYLQKNP